VKETRQLKKRVLIGRGACQSPTVVWGSPGSRC